VCCMMCIMHVYGDPHPKCPECRYTLPDDLTFPTCFPLLSIAEALPVSTRERLAQSQQKARQVVQAQMPRRDSRSRSPHRKSRSKGRKQASK